MGAIGCKALIGGDDLAFVDALARLSVYTIPSSAPAYTSPLPHFLPPCSSLPQTLVMIVLDWTRRGHL